MDGRSAKQGYFPEGSSILYSAITRWNAAASVGEAQNPFALLAGRQTAGVFSHAVNDARRAVPYASQIAGR
jgi:hypothetical protein